MKYDMSKESFLTLIRLGLGNHTLPLQGYIDWSTLQDLATQHGLSAVLLDGIEKLPENKRPPKELTLQWIGEVLHGYEQRYVLYRCAIAEMTAFYKSYGVKMMLLKGLACGIDWPKPEHRPYGDIDIWQFGKQREADELLIKKGVKVDSSHHHHTVFYWREFMVENHYDFINIHHHKSNYELEKLLKKLGQDDSHTINVNGEIVCIPSPNLHALFLLKHTMSHFAAEGIRLRQIIDWGFFVKAHAKEIDWSWLEGVLNEYGMLPAYNIFNALCVADLGFESSIFPKVQFCPFLKERVLNEILEPEIERKVPKGIIKRVAYKLRRWKANRWKHQMCYNDNLYSAFFRGIWNHLLKPSSI